MCVCVCVCVCVHVYTTNHTCFAGACVLTFLSSLASAPLRKQQVVARLGFCLLGRKKREREREGGKKEKKKTKKKTRPERRRNSAAPTAADIPAGTVTTGDLGVLSASLDV